MDRFCYEKKRFCDILEEYFAGMNMKVFTQWADATRMRVPCPYCDMRDTSCAQARPPTTA